MQDMYDAAKAMIERETELAPKPVPKVVECGSHLRNPEELVGMPVFPPATKSLLSKHLTPEVWELLAHSVDKHGFSFKQAIFSGC